ncbi:unnamed protein product, partial [Ixodes hexagonus]
AGGAASLIAAAGSILGVGTDLAGSIRQPSAFCGLFGHKPTGGLVSNDGLFPNLGETLSGYNGTGPICRYAQDLPVMLRIMAGPSAPKLRLDEKVRQKQRLTKKRGHKTPCTCLSFQAVGYLSQGENPRHIRLKFEEFKNSFDTWLAAYVKSKAPALGDVFKRQEDKMNITKEVLRTLTGTCKHTPAAIKLSMSSGASRIQQQSYVEKGWNMAMSLQHRMEKLLGDNAVLLLPGTMNAALFHHQEIAFFESLDMTCLFNIIKLPVTSCPILRNDDGLPLGVQVVASRGHDRLSLAVAQKLQQGFGGWKDPSMKN